MDAVYAAAVVGVFVALGEVLSTWSKARIPSLLVAMLGLFAFSALGLIPKTTVEDSTLTVLYPIIIGPVLFHMGSMIPIRNLLAQWRSVIISVAGMLFAVVALYFVIGTFFGFPEFVAGAGPLAGGIIATSLTTEGMTAHTVESSIIVLPAMVLMLQSLPAMPMTNFLLRRFAIKLVESGELAEMAAKHAEATEKAKNKRTLITLPKVLVENDICLLAILLVGGALATLISIPTHIPVSIIALLMGIGSTAIGLTPERVMEKSNSFTIAEVMVVAIVIGPLLNANISEVISALPLTATILLVGSTGIMIGGALATKLLKWRAHLGMSVSLTAMYGFPADFLITNEVARSIGRTDAERDSLREVMLPPMLVGGFTSVSVGSVVIASVLVGML